MAGGTKLDDKKPTAPPNAAKSGDLKKAAEDPKKVDAKKSEPDLKKEKD